LDTCNRGRIARPHLQSRRVHTLPCAAVFIGEASKGAGATWTQTRRDAVTSPSAAGAALFVLRCNKTPRTREGGGATVACALIDVHLSCGIDSLRCSLTCALPAARQLRRSVVKRSGLEAGVLSCDFACWTARADARLAERRAPALLRNPESTQVCPARSSPGPASTRIGKTRSPGRQPRAQLNFSTLRVWARVQKIRLRCWSTQLLHR